jgi:hypothetical protein
MVKTGFYLRTSIQCRIYCIVSRPQVVASWLNSPLGRVGLRFESRLCFFLPSTRHQEIQGVGYAHHTCGRRPWVWTLLTVLVRLPLSIRDSIHDLLGLSPPLPDQGARAGYLELPWKKFVHGSLKPVELVQSFTVLWASIPELPASCGKMLKTNISVYNLYRLACVSTLRSSRNHMSNHDFWLKSVWTALDFRWFCLLLIFSLG